VSPDLADSVTPRTAGRDDGALRWIAWAAAQGAVAERPDLAAQGYRRFRCRDCNQQFKERSNGVLNRTSLPSDMPAAI